MEARVQKWGNSYGIRIPSSLLKDLNIKVNDIFNIEKVDNKIVLSISRNKKYNLEEAVANYNGKKLDNDFDWGIEVGKEIW